MTSVAVIGHGKSPVGKGWGPLIDACGVYLLETRPGQFYVGSSCRIKHRVRAHYLALKRGKHHSRKLQRSFDKNRCLSAKVLLICRVEELLFYEQLLLDEFRPPLNTSYFAGRVEWTPELIAQMSAKKIGNPSFTGRKHRASTLVKMRKSALRRFEKFGYPSTGKKRPAEAIEKDRERRKAAWKAGKYNNSNFHPPGCKRELKK